MCLCWLVRTLNMDFNLRPDYIQLRANYDILLVKLLQNEKKKLNNFWQTTVMCQYDCAKTTYIKETLQYQK